MTVYVVDFLVMPGDSNPEGKQYSKLPFKTPHLYTNKKRKYFYGYRIFNDKNTAKRAYKLYLKKFKWWAPDKKEPWVIVGGSGDVEEFENERKALENIRKTCKKFYRYKVF